MMLGLCPMRANPARATNAVGGIQLAPDLIVLQPDRVSDLVRDNEFAAAVP